MTIDFHECVGAYDTNVRLMNRLWSERRMEGTGSHFELQCVFYLKKIWKYVNAVPVFAVRDSLRRW